MSVIYCHRGNHYMDLDFENDGVFIDGPMNELWCCWDHLTEEEQDALERKEEIDREGQGGVLLIARLLWCSALITLILGALYLYLPPSYVVYILQKITP